MRELADLDQYRPNVGICLFNAHGDVWLGKRIATSQAQERFPFRWQMPQGGVDMGETAADAAARELYEETGIRSAELLFTTPGWLVYDFPKDYRARKRDRWRGQKQKWAVMAFTGEDSEVDLEAHAPHEFCDWRWAPLDEVPDLVVPFKRGVYAALASSFAPFARYLAKTKG